MGADKWRRYQLAKMVLFPNWTNKNMLISQNMLVLSLNSSNLFYCYSSEIESWLKLRLICTSQLTWYSFFTCQHNVKVGLFFKRFFRTRVLAPRRNNSIGLFGFLDISSLFRTMCTDILHFVSSIYYKSSFSLTFIRCCLISYWTPERCFFYNTNDLISAPERD